MRSDGYAERGKDKGMGAVCQGCCPPLSRPRRRPREQDGNKQRQRRESMNQPRSPAMNDRADTTTGAGVALDVSQGRERPVGELPVLRSLLPDGLRGAGP